MKNCMILLTSEYPYANGEPFLESEIFSLKDKFEKIIVLAIDLEPNLPLTRVVPENVDCINVTTKSKKLGRAGDIFRGAINSVGKSDYYKYDKDKIGSSLQKRVFFEYFCERSKREAELCRNCLKKYDFSQYGSITIYSYWFFVTAMIGSTIKSELSSLCGNIKLISRAHRYDLYENKNRLNYLPLRKYLLEKVDAVYPCSVDGEKYLRSSNEEFSDKINYSYLGTFDSGIARPSNDGVHIVSCSKLAPWKRVERIAQVLRLCKSSCPIKWTHIGDGEMMATLIKITGDLPKNITVDFTGKLANTQVYNFYRENPVDVFINVSSSEGLPVSIMEAMSFGIPVIATDVGGTSEIVKDNYNGWLLRPDFTDEELADIIKNLIQADRTSMDSVRKNARSTWNDNFNAEKNYAEFSEKLIGKQKVGI